MNESAGGSLVTLRHGSRELEAEWLGNDAIIVMSAVVTR